MMRNRLVGCAGLAWILGALAAAPLAAQIPGDELPSVSRARQEYLNLAYTEVRDRLTEWTDLVRKGDTQRLGRMFTEDGLYSPIDGWYVQGRSAVVDSLTARLTRTSGYHLSFLDFAASGSLAYYMGRIRYSLDDSERPLVVEGTFVMVLFQEGKTWRVRSYVERLAD